MLVAELSAEFAVGSSQTASLSWNEITFLLQIPVAANLQVKRNLGCLHRQRTQNC